MKNPTLFFRPTALKGPLNEEEEDQQWDPSEVPSEQFREDSPTWSQHSGSYTVLPPIGKPLRRTQAELGYEQSEEGVNVQRVGSDGYLVQMMKQKQLKERVSYKVGLSVFTHSASAKAQVRICPLSVYLETKDFPL